MPVLSKILLNFTAELTPLFTITGMSTFEYVDK